VSRGKGDETAPPGKFLKNLLIKMQEDTKWCGPFRICQKYCQGFWQKFELPRIFNRVRFESSILGCTHFGIIKNSNVFITPYSYGLQCFRQLFYFLDS
jgi:hypothetical protein